jgi:dTDP-4-dehydrorhamnose reductase
MKKKLKILVTGGSGMVGSQVKFGIKPSHKELDINNSTSIEKAVKKYKPDVILHLAAFANMLGCEGSKIKAKKINVTGTQNIARACKKNDMKLVYMSTCAVFDGKKKTPYKESDRAKTLNVYGETKLGGEKIIQKILPNALIVRTGWLFGGNKTDKKFVQLTYQKFKNGEEVMATSDRKGSPTYVKDLLDTIEKLIYQNKSGIYHVVNSGTASYADIAKEIKKVGKFKQEIKKVLARDIENKKLKRGKNESLASSKIKLRSWKVALKEYLN